MTKARIALASAAIAVGALTAQTAGSTAAQQTCPPGTNNPAYCVTKIHPPGFYCKAAGESKKHVKGQKGTPFSAAGKFKHDLGQ